jgi:hypothetical protein
LAWGFELELELEPVLEVEPRLDLLLRWMRWAWVLA